MSRAYEHPSGNQLIRRSEQECLNILTADDFDKMISIYSRADLVDWLMMH